ncbi:MAG: diphthine synthase [Candidatus Bathyarchaeota archaeon]|nr:MAG: diphthine synthase [Candidatus Bathyarchaeota archaeon]
MGELVFVGLGLYSERDISLRGLEEIKQADKIFAELYTSLMPELSIQKLEELVGKKISVVSRRTLEEEGGQLIIKEAAKRKVALLVPGDPLIATTHVDLRIRAEKRGIKTRIVHGASIISAVMGLSGLQNYKYGKSVTIPFPEDKFTSETPYRVIMENRKRGLHTLCFLDIKAEEKKYMTVKDGLELLLATEKRRKKKVITPDTLVIGIARAGSGNIAVKANYVRNMMKYNFGAPPHTLVFPGKLHFMEVEALITLVKAPEQVRERN